MCRATVHTSNRSYASPLIHALPSDGDAFFGHPDAGVEERARVGVPRELSGPVLAGDGDLLTALGTGDDFERLGDAAADLVGLVLAGRPVLVRDDHPSCHGIRTLVLDGEVETARLRVVRQGRTATQRPGRGDGEEVTAVQTLCIRAGRFK